MALQDIYKKASLVMKPAAMKEGKLYSQQPHSGDGDFTFSRANGVQTRINKHGLIEAVADNTPRLSYELDSNGNVSECPHLLLEPTRTNQITNSKDFEGWQDLRSNSTTTNNNTTAPDGTNTAATIEKTGSDTTILRFFTSYSNFSTIRSASIYIKKLSGNPTISFGITDTQDSITPTNEWVRYTKDNVTPTNFGVPIFLDVEVSGVSGDAVAVWGAQLEEGTYSTSHIPTSGSTEARAQGDFQNTFTGLTGTSATIFLDFETKALDSNFARLFAVNDSVTGDAIYLGMYSTNTIGFFGIDGGAGLPDYKDVISFNERNKLVLTFDGGGNYKYSLNGSIQTGSYTGTSRQYNEVGRGNIVGASSNNIQVHQLVVFNEELSSSEIIELTS